MKPQLALLGLALGAAVVGACAAATHAQTGGTGGATAGSATGGSASGGSATGGSTTSGSATTGSASAGGSDAGLSTDSGTCPTHCSSDLHAVVDCTGTVLMTCPSDQGCGAAGCVAPCQSALENKGTLGCEYYIVDPDIIAPGAGSCFAAFVANTWTVPVTMQIDRAGKSIDAASIAYLPVGSGRGITYTPLPNGEIPPGKMAIVFLAQYGKALSPCPPGVNVGFTATDIAVHGTALGDAVHLTTSLPVVAYDIFPYGGGPTQTTSATLLLPTPVWDTNYIAISAFRKSTYVPEAQPSLNIVAAEDGTKVTISPTATIQPGNFVQGTLQGKPWTYTLNKGQILQFTQDAPLLGSPIQSDKPIAVWGAATCLSIEVNKQACDSAHQQIPPIKALGHEYVAVRYRNRFDGVEETPPWRIVGAVDGTILSYDPPPPSNAPPTLNVGDVGEFRLAGPFTIKSQDADHPFYMSAHMTGCEEVDPTFADCRGNPEFVNVVPPQQYLGSYVFFTDPTYPETNLVFVRSKTASGFKDVTLDCAGTLTGWTPVGSGGQYEYTRVDLVRHDFAPQGQCDNGWHEAHSDGPFGLTVWGWGTAETGGLPPQYPPPPTGFYSQAVSYAYPAGASVQSINQVVVPPVTK